MRKSSIRALRAGSVRPILSFTFILLADPFVTDPYCIERQIAAHIPKGRLALAEKRKSWLERQKIKGREFSVIVRVR